ncbi:MAG TPA: type II secretion system F family protein, partial [Azospirillum sp.]
GAAATAALPLLAAQADAAVLALLVLSAVAVGFYLPAAWLSARVRGRQRQIREAFPDALDLLLVCVEAGLGLDAAIARVGDELAPIHPVLAQQFMIMGLELRAGRSREDALRGLGERSGLDEVRAFVNLLVQSDRLGTSIGDALRVGADEMRSRRMLRAEEKAHQLPVKLSVPLVLFLLPGLVTVIMLPPAIQVLRVLTPAMSGQ